VQPLSAGSEPPPLRLQVLGRFRAQRGEEQIADTAWQRPPARTLIKLLAVQRGHRLHQDQVLDLLWPDLSPESAATALRKALTYARRALEPGLPPRAPCAYLQVSHGVVLLDQRMVQVDADLFEEAAATALRAGANRRSLEVAVALYTDEVLPEDRYEEWAIERREQLAELHLHLLHRLAEVLEREGAYGEAITQLHEMLVHDPAREEAHRAVMRLHALSGSRHQALRQYQACRRVLLEELGVEPEAESEQLYQSLLAGEGPSVQAPRHPGVQHPPAALPAAIVRRLAPGSFMGRERPLELAMGELSGSVAERHTAGSRRSALMISGEAGVGKSRLAAEVARMAHQQGALILWGGSYEQEGALPYGPFVGMLDEHLTRQSEADRQRLAQAYPELSSLVPALSGIFPQPDQRSPMLASDMARLRLFAAVAGLLADIASGQPVVLVLDDLHTADAASLQLLHYVARHSHQQPWLLVGTYREEDVEPEGALTTLLVALAAEGLSRHISLLRLARSDTADLVRSRLVGEVPRDILDRIYELSLGNPLFTVESIQAMRERGELVRVDGVWCMSHNIPSVPYRVADLLMLRINALTEDAQRVLTCAAVSGMESSFAVLRSASERVFGTSLSDARLFDALDAALRAHLLEEREDGYAFRHPLMRSTLYERTSRHRRAYLHATLAAVLEQQRPDEAAAIAYHYDAAGEEHNATVYFERAGDRAWMVHANEMAETYYRDVVHRLERLQRPLEAARVRRKLGDVLITMSRFEEALPMLTAASATYRELGDLEGLGQAVAASGRVYRWQGRPDLGLEQVEQALEAVPGVEGASPALVALKAVHSELLFALGRFDESLEQAEAGARLSRAAGNDSILAEMEGRRGTILSMSGNITEGRDIMQSALALAERAGNLETARGLLQSLAAGFHAEGRFLEARHYVERSLDLAERLGNPMQVGHALTFLGNLLLHLGAVGEGERHITRAVTTFEAIGPSWPLAYAIASLGSYSLFKGEWEQAREHLVRAAAMAESCGHVQVARYAQIMMAEQNLMVGKPEDALPRLDALLASEGGHVSTILALIAWARAEIGDTEGALQAVQEAVRGAEDEGNRENLVTALWVQGMIERRRACWEHAEQAFAHTLQLATEMSYPFMEARALYERGLMHVARGDPPSAEEDLAAALSIFTRLGAAAYADWTDAALTMVSGVRPGEVRDWG